MHNTSHRALFANARINDRVGSWFCGNPVGASLARYRPYHLQHYRNTQQADDPDLSLSTPFPISRASFRRKVIRDLLGNMSVPAGLIDADAALARCSRRLHRRTSRLQWPGARR